MTTSGPEDKPRRVFNALHFEAEVIDLYQHGIRSGQSTGWSELDQFYTVHADQLTIVTGVPGHGKSEWLDALMVNLASKDNWLFAIFSPENNPIKLHLRKLLEKRVGLPFGEGPNHRMTQDQLLHALSWVNEHMGFVHYPIDHSPDLLSALEDCRYWLHAQKPAAKYGIVIDPWNELESARAFDQTETSYVNQSLSLLRRFARAGPYHVWLVAHPRVMHREKDGKIPVPGPYDISGSAHWFNKADNCITVWREANSSNVEIHVQKVRFKHTGHSGKAHLSYDKITGQYRDSTRQPGED